MGAPLRRSTVWRREKQLVKTWATTVVPLLRGRLLSKGTPARTQNFPRPKPHRENNVKKEAEFEKNSQKGARNTAVAGREQDIARNSQQSEQRRRRLATATSMMAGNKQEKGGKQSTKNNWSVAEVNFGLQHSVAQMTRSTVNTADYWTGNK